MGFARVEIFLSAFPGDPNIKDASVDLIACILKAVEGAIVYFLSSTGKAKNYLYLALQIPLLKMLTSFHFVKLAGP